MFLRQLDLTTALRPALHDDESLIFVQDGVGLYEGKYKIPNYQNGHAYLTSHRICYVDNAEPRKYSLGVDLKDVDRCEFYAGFLKSSAKITIFPKSNLRRASHPLKSPSLRQVNGENTSSLTSSQISRSHPSSPAPFRDPNATWICPICGLSNTVPSNFDPALANQHTPLPPCQACGIKPPLALMIKAAIAARSNRPAVSSQTLTGQTSDASPSDSGALSFDNVTSSPSRDGSTSGRNKCPRCTFQNHPSLASCEICGAKLPNPRERISNLATQQASRAESPGPTAPTSILIDETIETVKLSFRAGGEKLFHERLRNALVQRKWLLQSAPPVPKATRPSGEFLPNSINGTVNPNLPPQRVVGIAGLERRGAELRQNNQAVIGTAFEDLEALMTSAKEVIAMAEEFAKRNQSGASDEDRKFLSASESALGLMTTKDMLGGGSAAETTYIKELSRNLAEFLTDDRRGVLRREGGVMSLVDLWAVFNRTRKGVELISPLDFEKAARTWDTLNLPIRLRRFKSGLLVVQERSRSDAKTIASLIAWLREPCLTSLQASVVESSLGKGVTAQEAAEKFGWSVGVAVEELEMAEETGALCCDQCLDGTRFWENHITRWATEESGSFMTKTMKSLEV